MMNLPRKVAALTSRKATLYTYFFVIVLEVEVKLNNNTTTHKKRKLSSTQNIRMHKTM